MTAPTYDPALCERLCRICREVIATFDALPGPTPGAAVHRHLAARAKISAIADQLEAAANVVDRLRVQDRRQAQIIATLDAQHNAEIDRIRAEASTLCKAVTAERDKLQAEAERLQTRQQELLAALVRVTNETPFPDEIKGWTEQRAKLVAEVGTLRAQVVAARRDADFVVVSAKRQEQAVITETITVESCLLCPFYRPILCTLMHSCPSAIVAPALPPPDWCPLREADRLVTLRVK